MNFQHTISTSTQSATGDTGRIWSAEPGAAGGCSSRACNTSTLLDLIYNWPAGPNIVMLTHIHFT